MAFPFSTSKAGRWRNRKQPLTSSLPPSACRETGARAISRVLAEITLSRSWMLTRSSDVKFGICTLPPCSFAPLSVRGGAMTEHDLLRLTEFASRAVVPWQWGVRFLRGKVWWSSLYYWDTTLQKD